MIKNKIKDTEKKKKPEEVTSEVEDEPAYPCEGCHYGGTGFLCFTAEHGCIKSWLADLEKKRKAAKNVEITSAQPGSAQQ